MIASVQLQQVILGRSSAAFAGRWRSRAKHILCAVLFIVICCTPHRDAFASAPSPEATPPGSDPEAVPDNAASLEAFEALDPCAELDRNGPLHELLKFLRDKADNPESATCEPSPLSSEGLQIVARVASAQPQAILEQAAIIATAGLEVRVTPEARNVLFFRASLSATRRRGVTLSTISATELRLSDDFELLIEEELKNALGALSGDLDFAELIARSEGISARLELFAEAPGKLRIEVTPVRIIRRVRVRGALPLSDRSIRRALSIDSRPGSFARGQCVSPRKARKKETTTTCAEDDLSCELWERREIERVRRHLFDNGFMSPSAHIALVCGRDSNEADLLLTLKKGKPTFFLPRDMTVEGLEDRSDPRWIKRFFTPRVLGFIPKRVTRDFVEEATSRVESTFGSSSSYGRLVRSASAKDGVMRATVRTSYEDFDLSRPASIPSGRNAPLLITVGLSQPLRLAFESATDGSLALSQQELAKHLNLSRSKEQISVRTAIRDAAKLRSFYQSKGYPLAAVEGFFEPRGDTNVLRFSIVEGPKARIRGISLIGPRGVPPEIVDRVRTEWLKSGSLQVRDFFSEKSSLDDLKQILGDFAKSGYLCSSATLQLAFWPDGFKEPREHVRFGLNELFEGGGRPGWEAQLDPVGLETLRTARRIDLYIQVSVRPGPRFLTARTEDIQYLQAPIPSDRRVLGAESSEEGNWGANRILEGTPLRGTTRDGAGDVPISTSIDGTAQDAIVEKYLNNGYPFADAELDWFYGGDKGSDSDQIIMSTPREVADRGLCKENRGKISVALVPILSVYEGKKAKFGDIRFRGNFKTQDWVLRRGIRFKPGADYSQDGVNKSLGRMQDTGTISGARVFEYPDPITCSDDAPEGECRIDQVISVDEAKDIAAELRFGLGGQTLNPLYVFVRPRFPNVFGTGVDLEAEALWGFPLTPLLSSTDFCGGLECYERHASATIIRNQIFGGPLNLELTGQFSRRVTPARGRLDAAFAQLRATWRVGQRASMYAGYIAQLANVSKDSVRPLGGGTGAFLSRRDAVVSDLTGVLESGFSWTNTDNAFNPSKGLIASVALRLASSLPANSWWYSHEFTFQHFVPLGRSERFNFRYSLRYGEAFPFKGPSGEATTIPEVWRFYGGGTADLGLRGILPETMYVDIETVQTSAGGVLYRPRAVGGHIRAIGTLALQVTSMDDFLGGRLAHSLFYDFGVLGQKWSQLSILRDYRQSIGINAIKWDVNVVTLALGYAILVPTKNNRRATDDRNGRVVFDVGVTF